MTSLEHESNETSASASDYGQNDWDNENWGEMDVSGVSLQFLKLEYCFDCCFVSLQTSQDPSSPLAAGVANNGQVRAPHTLGEIKDGWENEEWGSLEEDPVVRYINLL